MELALQQTYQDTCNCIKSRIKLEFEKRQQVKSQPCLGLFCSFHTIPPFFTIQSSLLMQEHLMNYFRLLKKICKIFWTGLCTISIWIWEGIIFTCVVKYMFSLICSMKIFYVKESWRCYMDSVCTLSLLFSLLNELCLFYESSVLYAQDQHCKITARRYYWVVFEKYLKLQYWWIMWYSSRGQVC